MRMHAFGMQYVSKFLLPEVRFRLAVWYIVRDKKKRAANMLDGVT